MGDAAIPNKSGGLFASTQRAYWGGPWYPYWSLILMTIVGGLFGLDHLYLRSPLTAIAKLFVNIFGFGLWFVYDLLQILGEPESVQKNGLSIPIYGAAGIGSGMFTDDQPGATTSKSPLRWLAYMILVFMPFGFDLLVAGDMNGAAAKFLSTILFFLWPIAFIWSAFSIGKAWLTPKSIWEDGTTRMFPFTFFMESNGRSVLGPVDVPNTTDGCDPGGKNGIISSLFGIVGRSAGVLFPGLVPAVGAASAAVTAGSTAAKVGFDTATSVIEKTGDAAKSVLDLAADPSSLAAVGNIASGVGSNLEKFQNPEALRAAVGLQKGGGLSGNDELSSLALLAFFLFVFGSGSYLVAKRLNIQIPFFTKPEPNGPQRNDAPPKPSSV